MRYIDTRELYAKKDTWGNSSELWTNALLKEDYGKAFGNKCWYTEEKFAGSDIHIDHFRPKAKVGKFRNYNYNKTLEKCGYHWLANDYKNYRACCICSNRITGEGGKGTYFPLKDGSELLTVSGNENEEIMLLDPLNKDDVKLLTFYKNTVLCATSDIYDQERVEASKVIYNLIDNKITVERLTVWDSIEQLLRSYESLDVTRKHCLMELKKAVSKESRYSSCAIACVNSLAPDELKNDLNLDL